LLFEIEKMDIGVGDQHGVNATYCAGVGVIVIVDVWVVVSETVLVAVIVHVCVPVCDMVPVTVGVLV
jgi:hypothetical protein